MSSMVIQQEIRTYRIPSKSIQSLENSSPEFPLPLPYRVCFNHHSVIQNFFQDAFLTDYIPASDISRNHDRQNKAKLLIPDYQPEGTLEEYEKYDYIPNIIKAFREWRLSYWTNPKVAYAVGESLDGNPRDIFWELKNRFDSNRNIAPLSEALESYKGNGVFLTLTYDHSKDLKQTWQEVSKDWNRFMSRLKHELKDEDPDFDSKSVKYLRVLEAQGNGYPHIHAVFFGIDWLYKAGNKLAWTEDNPHSKNLKHFWKRGSVFINSTKQGQAVRNPVDYMMKYIRKTFSDDSDKSELTQAMLWAFNKRSFDMSRGLVEWLTAQAPIQVSEPVLIEAFARAPKNTMVKMFGIHGVPVKVVISRMPEIWIGDNKIYYGSDLDSSFDISALENNKFPDRIIPDLVDRIQGQVENLQAAIGNKSTAELKGILRYERFNEEHPQRTPYVRIIKVHAPKPDLACYQDREYDYVCLPCESTGNGEVFSFSGVMDHVKSEHPWLTDYKGSVKRIYGKQSRSSRSPEYEIYCSYRQSPY